jgi:hypothetical protein
MRKNSSIEKMRIAVLILDFGFWILDFGFWILDYFSVQDTAPFEGGNPSEWGNPKSAI